VAAPKSLSWFRSEGDQLVLNLGTLGTGVVEGDLPLLAWARASDPYTACHQAWGVAIRHELIGASTRFREEKQYPRIFRYLGWCSWEEFKSSIDQDILVEVAQSIERSGLPIRYMLIDDGHVDHEARQLKSFEPDRSKFPGGWRKLLSMRKPHQITWMGLWLNMNGHWRGVHLQNALGGLNEHLRSVTWPRLGPLMKATALVPKQGMLHSFAFFDAMIGAARKAGFDFVKVDNQARSLWAYRGTQQPVVCATENSQALEAACARHMDGLINCMAHNSVCIFNTRISVVTRCSEDYRLDDLARARRHLHNSYGNIPWLGQTVWGDHDMFHSNDPVCGRVMAVSKALSGGPVYLSDDPSSFAPEHIWPLCYGDGELLRPLAPAAPLPESLFLNPYEEREAFRVIAPLPNKSAAVAAYNLTEPEAPVHGVVSAKDYAHAGAMIQPKTGMWAPPEEGLLLYDWYPEEAMPLQEEYQFTLEGFGDRLFLLCPIRSGWSVIGRADKFLSPAAVEVLEYSPNELLLRMKESGPLTIWHREARLSSEMCEFKHIGSGLWRADMPEGRRGVLVRVRCEP